MKSTIARAAALAATLMTLSAAPVHAAIIISEAAPYASGNAAYAADWFELTNTGATAVNISGWKMDDNSNSFGSSVALSGVSSLAAGQSAVFLEGLADGSNFATIDAGFRSAWFGAGAPAGLLIGNYGGAGVSLSTSTDAVNIFDAAGALVTRVDFGASTAGVSFDNAAGLNNVTLSKLSAIGVNGAFKSFDAAEIGSPGSIAAVPEPETYLMLLAGLASLMWVRRARR
jgi:hypothetical protein